jgi:hypothetical protein
MNFPFAFRRRNKKPRTSRTTCRPTFEVLEGRVVPANGSFSTEGLVTGTVYRDLNDNGAHDANEPGLANRLVLE